MAEQGVEVEWRNFDKDTLSKAELGKLIGDRDLADFLNPRSTPWRELGLKDKKISKKRAIELILEDVNLLKRPLLMKGKTFVFGFKEDAWKETLGL